MGYIKNLFSLFLRTNTCHFSRGLHYGYGPKDYIFQGQTQKFAGDWLERNNLSKLKFVIEDMFLKLQTNVRVMRTRMNFFCKRNKEIFLQLSLIIRQLKKTVYESG